MIRFSSLTKSIFYGSIATGEMVVRSIAEGFLTAVESFEPKDDRLYKSSFGDVTELLDSGYKGFNLNGNNLSLSDAYRNAILFGNTGAGKGVNVIIPSLLTMSGATMIVNDPAGENFEKTSGYYQGKGYTVCTINFSKPENSHSYNPLDYIKSEADINKLSALLVKATLTSNSSDPFWQIQAKNILRIFISITLKQEKQYRNLGNVLHLLTAFRGSPKSVDKIFIRHASDKLMNDYKSYVAMDVKLLSSIVSTAQASLQLFNDPDVARATSMSTIDFSTIRKAPTVIYVQTNTADSDYYKTLVSVFFEQLMQFLLSHLPDKKELDVFLILDEAASLNLPTLPLSLTNLRKYRCGILTAWQSKQQMIHCYGNFDTEVIIDNSLTKVYLTGQGLQTAKELEDMIGRTEVRDANDRVVVKPLLLSEEIRQMDKNQALILSGNRKPFLVTLKPYYTQPFLNLRTKKKPADTINALVQTSVPLIPLL